jgi:hypothetical protein
MHLWNLPQPNHGFFSVGTTGPVPSGLQVRGFSILVAVERFAASKGTSGASGSTLKRSCLSLYRYYRSGVQSTVCPDVHAIPNEVRFCIHG